MIWILGKKGREQKIAEKIFHFFVTIHPWLRYDR